MIEIVKFENIKYPIREIKFPFGNRTIGIEKLNNVLIDKCGGYVSEKARLIDESIFYFVKESSLFMNEKKLSLKIISEL